MKYSQKGFSLIELLVTIVIIGILASIAISTFTGYFEQANNSKRESNVATVSHIIKVGHATEWDGTKKYILDQTALQNLLAEHDVNIEELSPEKNGGFCFFYGYNTAGALTSAMVDNEYFVASWRVLEGGSSGSVIVDGTTGGMETVNSADWGTDPANDIFHTDGTNACQTTNFETTIDAIQDYTITEITG